MDVELQINNSTNAAAQFVTWAPSPCRIRMTNSAGATPPAVSIKLSSVSAAGGGAVGFRTGTSGAFASTLTLTVPTNGASVSFFTAGTAASSNNGDVKIEARAGNTLVGSASLMVRIRKNANTLKPPEKTRFVAAYAQLNNQGLGRFTDFREMHRTQLALNQAHGAAGFLPWHRAYLLDLERELQAIDSSVALPYWRFDQAAPNIFKLDFMGVSNANGTVAFANNNPLQFWRTDGQTGVNRRPFFNTANAPPGLLNEAQTLALGTSYSQFRGPMEGNPHGSAHVSFGGFISSTSTAPRDPLFFLLHCNVDRLWAKWQRQNNRFNPAVVASFNNNNASPIGHRLQDTMWPWNGVTGGTRPPNAPGGTMAPSPIVPAPGLSPFVRDMLDYHGVINPASNEAFDYDDVPL